MFCPIERMELQTAHCPALKCMYKGANQACAHEKLTREGVTAYDIADIKGLKAYKVKAEASMTKDAIAKGIVVMKYSSFIKDSFANSGADPNLDLSQTVNDDKDLHVSEVLLNVFGLSVYQQSKFWERERYTSWAQRLDVPYSLKELQAVLETASIVPSV